MGKSANVGSFLQFSRHLLEILTQHERAESRRQKRHDHYGISVKQIQLAHRRKVRNDFCFKRQHHRGKEQAEQEIAASEFQKDERIGTH